MRYDQQMLKRYICFFQLFPQIDNTMVEPLRLARDRYEGMKEQTAPPNPKSQKDQVYVYVKLVTMKVFLLDKSQNSMRLCLLGL